MNQAILSSSPSVIEKEAVKNLLFPALDVLTTEESKRNRRKRLEYCTTLGNNYKSKVVIYFADEEGFKKVNTTIWATTEQNIILKGNTIIPIHRIYKVDSL